MCPFSAQPGYTCLRPGLYQLARILRVHGMKVTVAARCIAVRTSEWQRTEMVRTRVFSRSQLVTTSRTLSRRAQSARLETFTRTGTLTLRQARCSDAY
jgi:hypothetical protein